MFAGSDLDLRLPSPLVELTDERLGSVRVLLKRDDLIHPRLTGNKWRKLKYLLADARRSGASTLLTCGGAYSNHIRAVAAVGRYWGFDTIGVIRGEERPVNDGLASAMADGMHRWLLVSLQPELVTTGRVRMRRLICACCGQRDWVVVGPL